jgi:hypothetical protein
MFWGATLFNGNDAMHGSECMSRWDVRGVTNMSGMFLDTHSFNGDIILSYKSTL